MEEEEATLKVSEIDIGKSRLPEIPDDIIFPDELNRYLREQIRYYRHENGMLQKNSSEIEFKYNNCKNKIAELESKLKNYEGDGKNIINSTQVASLKIVELSKKLREKNSEVEVLKTKNSKLQQLVYELKDKSEESINDKVEEATERPFNEIEEAVDKLEQRLNYTTNKLAEVRNSNMQLKNDLKLANKWLQQEIGESFESLQSINNSSGGWRGRAQIILDLQQKNSELREKLRNVNDKVSKSSIDLISSKAETKISFLCKENGDLRVQYEELKKKFEASRARCRVLETEVTILKSKCTMVKEQSNRDQEIISTLSAQISNTKDLKNGLLREKDGMINKLQTEKGALEKHIEEYKFTVKGLKDELEEITWKMQNLNALHSCHKCGKDYQTDKKINRLETERQKLLDLAKLQNKRLTAEREAHFKTQSLLRQEKQRLAKAEAAAARTELESSSSKSSYSTVSSSMKAMDANLKDQLELAEENVKALRTRLEIEQLERQTDLKEFGKILQSVDDKMESEET